jgi:alkaline phosphatase D
MLRRHFVQLFASGVLLALNACTRGVKSVPHYSFEHGVASGDPLEDGVIIWTRVSGASGEPVTVSWSVANNPDMHSPLRRGVAETGPDRDYTVKVDVSGLPAGAELYYAFRVEGAISPTGRTRTLPRGAVEAARFAVVSCSNYPYGYFHAYREIANRGDLDAVIHLGDYLYDYGLGEYATEYAEQLGRVPDPPHEIVTLSDYRRRHAQYKTDPDLQAMHAAHPMIAVWDDHEICNDTWRDGALNHDEGDGSWDERVDAATRAYVEWMPIRADARGKNTRIFRDFRYGDLLSLIMLDTRLHGRDKQTLLMPDMSDEEIDQILHAPDRRLLGDEQSSWLDASLENSRAGTWQVLGQQVLMSTLKSPDLEPLVDRSKPSTVSSRVLDYNITMSKKNLPLLLDTWDGYFAARERLFDKLKNKATNPVVISGDLHTSIAGDLVPSGADAPVAVEFMTTSVTSPGFREYLPEYEEGAISEAARAMNPNLKYMETTRRGWLCMTFTHTECIGEWHLLDGIRSSRYETTVDKRLSVRAGHIADGLQEA